MILKIIEILLLNVYVLAAIFAWSLLFILGIVVNVIEYIMNKINRRGEY